MCAKKNGNYVRYRIPKKNGGTREIFHPSKELKVMQYWLVKNIFSLFPVSKYSSAYGKGCSVKKNAVCHQEGKYILHTDIKNFFPSIDRKMLEQFFKKNHEIVKSLNLSESDINLIFDIVLYRGRTLAIGSVSAPVIANMLMYDFDNALFRQLSSKMDCQYTRYADDIVISSKTYIDPQIIEETNNLLISYGFEMNRDKTYFMSRKGKRQVTGVVIDNNESRLTIGNKRYKEFERMIYRYLVKEEGNLSYIKGYLAYIKDINEEQYMNIENIYKRYDKDNVLFRVD